MSYLKTGKLKCLKIICFNKIKINKWNFKNKNSNNTIHRLIKNKDGLWFLTKDLILELIIWHWPHFFTTSLIKVWKIIIDHKTETHCTKTLMGW